MAATKRSRKSAEGRRAMPHHATLSQLRHGALGHSQISTTANTYGHVFRRRYAKRPTPWIAPLVVLRRATFSATRPGDEGWSCSSDKKMQQFTHSLRQTGS